VKAIFLDIDGVLNDHVNWPNKSGRICYERVAHLNTILAAVPDAQIVLSSAWRHSFTDAKTIAAVLMVHGCNCNDRVHGCTNQDPDQANPPCWTNRAEWRRLGLMWRVDQIDLYIEMFEIYTYVVLDDLPLAIPNLVQTVDSIGLTAKLAQKAIEVLQR
jgi:hypothetical protein